MGVSAAFPAAAPGANVDITSLKGTTTNDSAAAGKIGQIIESTVLTGAAISITNATAADVTSISLTAGDWDVWGMVGIIPAGTTTVTRFDAWVSTTSATFPGPPNGGACSGIRATMETGIAQNLFAGQMRISIAGTTTVYLGVRSSFGVSTNTACGYIGARRVR